MKAVKAIYISKTGNCIKKNICYNNEKRLELSEKNREQEERGMEIAAQLYTVRAKTQTEADIAETLRKVKEIGYDWVQISGFGKCSPEFLRGELEKNGLRACATHTPLERIADDTEKVIAEHKMLGIPYVGLGYYAAKTTEEAKGFLKRIIPAAKKLHDSGLQFVYHNHFMEFARMENGQRVLDYYIEQTTPEEFSLLPDIYWLQFAGLSPEKFMKEYADRIQVIHLKDMKIDGESGERRFAEIYNGNMDYDSILKTAEQTGVRFAAVEQDECYGTDPFESLRISRKNIRERYGI